MTPIRRRALTESPDRVGGLPIVEAWRTSDTGSMSSEATQPGNPNVIGNPVHGSISSAGRGSGAPAAAPRRASRLRRWVFSLLAGVRLAAGGGALILMGWSGAEMLRSPLSAPMINGWWSFARSLLPAIALMFLPVTQVWRPASRRRGLVVCIIAFDFVIVSFLVLFTGLFGVEPIFRSGASIPGYIGRLAVGWVFLVIAVMSHLILRLYRPAAQPREERDGWASWPGAPRLEGAVAEYGRVFNPSPAAPADPQRTWRTAPASRVLSVGMGFVSVVVVAVIALTVPNLINNSFDRFVRITTDATISYDGFPTVAEISAAAAGGNQSSADPVWTATVGTGSVHQILAGVRGAVLVTRDGVYGLDSSTGEAIWSFATSRLNESSYDSLKRVDLYVENSAFTSPDGAWLAYAFDVTPDSSLSNADPREDVTRIVVLSTDTGRVSLDTQVTGAVPAVQLTDSNIVINRRVYSISSGRELSPLDDDKIAIPGPGGHSSVIVRDKHEEWRYLSSKMTLDVIPETDLGDDHSYSLNDRTIEAQVIAGRPVNVGGWVLNPVDDGTVENIDTGKAVSLRGEDKPENWNVVGIQASPQAISVWSVQNEVEGQAKDFGHPLSLNVFDTRRGEVTAIDPAGTYRAVEQSSERLSYPPYSGAVDTPVFSARVGDRNRHDFSDRLVVQQNDAARQDDGSAHSGGGGEPAWVSVFMPDFEIVSAPVALCPGGIIVSYDSSGKDEVVARRAPQQ